MDIAAIERKRRQMNIPVSSLCATAGIGRRTYDYVLGGRSQPTPATMAKLQRALGRYRIGFGGEAGQLAPHSTFRAVQVLAAFHLKVDARQAISADPARRATMDRDWRQAAKVRRAALYITNQFFGFTQSDLARAAGMTKQAVSAAIKELEDERDEDAALKALLDELEEVFA